MPHVSEQHAQHDPLLVVSLAAGDLTGADRDLATALLADCADCATLHDDLLAIARATAALPTAVRPRDFQISPEQAARLRPLGWRRFVAAFASPRLAMTRQLGVGLTTLGLAGLLVSVLPTVGLPSMGGSAAGASAAPPRAAASTEDSRIPTVESGASAAPSAAASAAPSASRSSTDVAGPVPSASGSYGALFGGSASPAPQRTSASNGDGSLGGVTAQGSGSGKSTTEPVTADRELLVQSQPGDAGPSLILVVSAILLAVGIALLVARRLARGMTGR